MVPVRSLLLASVVSLGLSAQGFEGRFAEIESVLNQHFRGPRLDEARERSNREIDAYNARSKALNAELAEARTRLELAQAPGKAAYEGLQKVDADLKASIPDGADKEGNVRYRARIAERNLLADKVKALSAEGQRALEAYNAFATRTKGELEAQRARVLAEQGALDRRAAGYESFVKSGGDIACFVRVNRLLADIRAALRKAETPSLLASFARVRAIRRELGAWAMAGQALNPKGLVIVEALVGDEACWLIVDSGATETILSPEVAEAAGLGAQEETVSLVVVGGLRLQGRRFRIPRLVAAGQSETNVSASAVRPTDLGIDGLLGQSFLKAFVYTIDEGKPGKLFLTRR